MLNKLFDIFNIASITMWIPVIYTFKEYCTRDNRVYLFIFGITLLCATIGFGLLSLWLTRFLDKDNLEKCVDIELADASFLPTYIGYFLVAFAVSNICQMFVAMLLIFVFLYLVRLQYFNVTYLVFGYHYYHVTTETHTKVFIICRKELRTTENLRFTNLRRINNTTYIEGGK